MAEGLRPSHTSPSEGLLPGTGPPLPQYLQIHIQDDPAEDIVAHFPRCFEFVDQAFDLASISKEGGKDEEGQEDHGKQGGVLIQ